MKDANIIEIRGLTKTFGHGEDAVTALDNIDLDIKKGEIFGIIGLSGAGKSTLVRCINMLEKPSDGSVVVDGLEMTALNKYELRNARRSIGMIFQQFNLLMQRTALQNICFPLEIAGVSAAKAKERAHELLKIVELEDKWNAYPAMLSGGQKQRVAIARALATNPNIILCDEATSALDPTTTRSILALLNDINAKLGITIVIITHEMRVIEEICTRVAIIDQSHIAEIGPVKDVFAHPKSAIAKRLVFPDGEKTEPFRGGRLVRLVFDGQLALEPIISSMVLACKAPVSITFADTKHIEGRIYGQMVIELPEDTLTAEKMLEFLKGREITCEEVIKGD